MGCAGSKLDELPAVALCKERCGFLDDAVRLRFQLADSHLAYITSLTRVASSFESLLLPSNHHNDNSDSAPTLTLPPHRKSHDPTPSSPPPKKTVSFHSRSNSNSGSHLHFDSDDDADSHLHLHDPDDDDESSPPLHHLHDGSHYPDQDPYLTGGGGGGGGGNFFHMNYMKNSRTAPSVVYGQRPPTSESVVQYGGGEPSDTSYPYASSYSYPYPAYPNYSGGGGGYYGYPGGPASSPPRVDAASTSKPPPPPPSPPRASAWDFLNLFEGSDKYYGEHVNTPSRDSKELREEEGIPDLEEEEEEEAKYNRHHYRSNFHQNEVVKEVLHGGGKSEVLHGGGKSAQPVPMMMAEEEPSSFYTQAAGPSTSVEKDNGGNRGGGGESGGGLEYEVHVVDKKVVGENRNEDGNHINNNNNNKDERKSAPRNLNELAYEIKSLFERASTCGNEVAKLLEAGSQPHQRSRKHASKMLQGVTTPLSLVSPHASTSKSAADASPSSSSDKTPQVSLEIDEELAVRSKNLSSTLQKLLLWEKKLYVEVKAEEKMRVAHEKNCKKLKRLDEKGAEAHKVDATRTLIRSLSTKMKMAIQIVDKISITINKIRDEELWPQLYELIQGLTRMWKSMLECHHSQCEVIREARSLAYIGSTRKLSGAHLEAAHELVSWTSSFSCWIGAQKGYVKALNNWLVRCLLYEPEETADGIVPFSPGRLGAPPVFVICHQWAQAMDRISEKEVIEAMCTFSVGVIQLCESDNVDIHQRVVTNKDLERKAKNVDREDQKIRKEIQALEKQIVRVAADGGGLSEDVVFQSDTSKNLQGNLRRVFEAMEQFMSESTKVYEEIMQRSEEERLAQGHERVS